MQTYMMLTGIPLAGFLHSATTYRAASFHVVCLHFQFHLAILYDEPRQKWLPTFVPHLQYVSSALREQLTTYLLSHLHPMHLAVDDELTTPTLLGRTVATESQWRILHVTTTNGTLSNCLLFHNTYH